MMIRQLTPVAVLMAAVFSSGANAAEAETRSEDVAAIKSVIAKRTAGFNKKDAAAQTMLFTDDADFYASNGTVHVVGPKQVEKVLTFVHNGVLKNATVEQTVTKVTFLAPDVAVATLNLTMKRPKKDGGTYKNRGLRIMVRQKGVWRIRTFMNQRVVESSVSQEDVKKITKEK